MHCETAFTSLQPFKAESSYRKKSTTTLVTTTTFIRISAQRPPLSATDLQRSPLPPAPPPPPSQEDEQQQPYTLPFAGDSFNSRSSAIAKPVVAYHLRRIRRHRAV